MKKKWRFEIEQNGGEYTGWIDIFAVHVQQTGSKSLIADGVEMEFDEAIFAVDINMDCQ